MQLTVGVLARRSGLTVRTLHHYDSIGLLKPSLRSATGYRLYDRANVERLHRIQALRQLGLSLTDIGIALSGPQAPLAEVVDRQIKQIDYELGTGAVLREHLVRLRTQLTDGHSPDLAAWLDMLGLMTTYEKYFSPTELEHLPLHTDPAVLSEWHALVTAVQAVVDSGATPDDPDAQTLALRWMDMEGRSTGNNPAFLMRLRVIGDMEPSLRQCSGVTPDIERFLEHSVVAARLIIFSRYLNEEEMVRMRAHYGRQMYTWPELIAELRTARVNTVPASDPSVQAIAQRWMTLFREYAGDDPATHARIRTAYSKEPDLRSGSAVDNELLEYVQEALASVEREKQ